MFLRCKVRRKDGKQHRYWSVVENTRVARGRVVQRHVLYLGEINDTQELAWRRSIGECATAHQPSVFLPREWRRARRRRRLALRQASAPVLHCPAERFSSTRMASSAPPA